MPEFIVKTEDGELTVNSDNIVSDGIVVTDKASLESEYVPKAEVEEHYTHNAQVRRERKNLIERDKVLEDEDLVDLVLSERGSKSKGPDIDEVRASIMKKEVEPLKDQISRMERRVKGNEIREAFRKAGFDEKFTSPAPNGGPSWVETAFERDLQFDHDSGRTLAFDADGNPVTSNNPSGNSPFMTATEFASKMAGSDEWKPFLSPDPKNESGKGRPGDKRTEKKTDMSDIKTWLAEGNTLDEWYEARGMKNLVRKQ